MTGRAIRFLVFRVVEPDAEASHARHLLVAFPAVGKIVCAKGSFFVMTRRAAVRLVRVHRDVDGRHLIASALWAVTTVAADGAVAGVIEIETDIFPRINNAVRRPWFVTGRTGTDIFFADDLVGRVTLEAGSVRVGSCRDGHAVSLRFMAGRAVRFLEMLRVIKMRLEALHRRKWFQLLGIRLRVTDHADRMIVVFELRSMTSGTSGVRGKFRLYGFLVALMTEQTGNRAVARTFVLELRKINVFH